jgi:hypothetical protein
VGCRDQRARRGHRRRPPADLLARRADRRRRPLDRRRRRPGLRAPVAYPTWIDALRDDSASALPRTDDAAR